MNSTNNTLSIALRDLITGIGRLPRAVRDSLDPKTETEAKIVSGQLDLIRSSLKMFDYMLPIAGAVVFVFDQFHSKITLGLWWAVLIAVCIGNELFLDRYKGSSPDLISNTHLSARQQTIACTLLTSVWSSVAILLWTPEFPANQIFIELLMCCTLAALATMASLHAASVLVPLVLVSASVIFVPLIKDAALHPVLIGITAIFVIMMDWHACMIHMRTSRMLKLENERTDLIERLQKAKAESDTAHRQAIGASRAKAEFLANMSHELRTPLNAIIGFSDIVRQKTFGDSAEKYSEYGGFIHQSGHHLLDLIGDILDLAKIDSGRKVLNREAVDLVNVVEDELEHARSGAAQKGVVVAQTRSSSVPLLHADPHAIRQILRHLLSNAVKFTPEGGQVEVCAMINGAREIELTVTDTGIGIGPEDQARIFDRSGGAPSNVTTAHRGSGLGLAIVKGLVDMHGGQIVLQSALGEGTRVSVVFAALSTLKDSERRVA